jgi:hypothetical protein
MALEIRIDNELVFSQALGENVLFPFNEIERDTATKALIAALATISGLMPQSYSASKEGGSDEHCSKNEQCQADQAGGVVLHLSERRGTQNAKKVPK